MLLWQDEDDLSNNHVAAKANSLADTDNHNQSGLLNKIKNQSEDNENYTEDETLYRVICSCSKGGVEYTTKNQKFTISSLSPGHDYNVKIYKADQSLTNWSEPALINFTTPFRKLDNIKIIKKERTSISIQWEPGHYSVKTHGRVVYKITLKMIDSRFSRRKIQMTDLLDNNTNKYNFKNLRPGTLYLIEIQVKSLDKPLLVSFPMSFKVRTSN